MRASLAWSARHGNKWCFGVSWRERVFPPHPWVIRQALCHWYLISFQLFWSSSFNFLFFPSRQLLLVRGVLISNRCVFSRISRWQASSLGASVHFSSPSVPPFKLVLRCLQAIDFLNVCFYYFQLNVQSLLWLWLWKPLQAMVTAVSTEPLKYYSWLLAGLLGSGRFRSECQDSLCSIGSPAYA